MKPAVYHRLAESDLVSSARFYEQRREFLGVNFLDLIEETLAKIQAKPDLGKPGVFGTRSRKMRRFPFRIVYLDEPAHIWIVAVAHLSRKPDYWLGRLD